MSSVGESPTKSGRRSTCSGSTVETFLRSTAFDPHARRAGASCYGYLRSIKSFNRARSGASSALTPSTLTSATMM